MDYPLCKKSRFQTAGKMIFSDNFEEEFSDEVSIKVVGLEVSFPKSPEMARSDQRIYFYAQNTKHVSVTPIVRHITCIPGPFGHPRRPFDGPIA